MAKRQRKNNSGHGSALIVSIILTFIILGAVVYSVAGQISSQMTQSAIDNLSESLGLLRGTIQAVLQKEAEFQKFIAQELALLEDPESFVLSYNTNKTMVKVSLIAAGENTGISNTGEVFSANSLDFSSGKKVDDLPLSSSYLNDMGTWAYTISCPVIKEGTQAATLYIEYIYDSLDEALPTKFYNNNATLYVMDAKSERFVLKPKGIGERTAGHLNLQDFYNANRILEPDIQEEVSESIQHGKHVMFYHHVRDRASLIYMWAVNDGALYLIGYVPIESIQQEGKAVNQNILIVVIVMLAAFLICCILYFLNERQKSHIRKEQEQERELHNQQLKEALQAAQIASSSKTMFLSNMSHDIRTPMNAILGFTTLLAKDADNPARVREYTKKITASGQHLLGLINDVLDVSKIESGKAVLTLGEFTLDSMISSIDTIIHPMAKGKNQKFDITVSGIKNERLIGDETRMNQILINLLSNSVKYTPEGGQIHLRIIGLDQRSSQYEHFKIEVEDNGYGMTPEYLKIIFDAFTRAENSTTNKIQGTGLGMAITKSIVELMGGTINVSSEVDKGTIFTVELELRIPDRIADGQFWQEKGILRILAVDDETYILDNIRTLMKDTGVITDTCSSGEDALQHIRQAKEEGYTYDVILMDWSMPGLDGIETTRLIRKEAQDGPSILILTACDWEEIEEEAESAGVDGFLTKPFFVSALKEKLLELHNDGKVSKVTKMPAEDGINEVLSGKHFLVAEDNEINSEILLALLDGEGASCKVAENGSLAVDLFSTSEPGTFDAILMDVQMPVMNGYDATRKIRSLSRADASTIPIIAMTANAFAEDIKDALDAGMNDHIAKPIDMEYIKVVLSKYLKDVLS
ncbi:MAG TPA: hybrid sensor histidine kinase/response regulator [Lachnospiraceae bacterium]|nr:hybrid sensor histidine kinase/response regulator [Lachnospiraceae bacterium]